MQNTPGFWKHGLTAAACATLAACGGGGSDDSGGGSGGGGSEGTTRQVSSITSPYKLHTPDGKTSTLQVDNTVVTITRAHSGELVSRTRTLSLDGRGTLTSTDDWQTATPASGTLPIAKGTSLLSDKVVVWCSRQWGGDALHVATHALELALDRLKDRTLRAYSCDAQDKLEGKDHVRFEQVSSGELQMVRQPASGQGAPFLPDGYQAQLLVQTPPSGGKAIVVAWVTPPLGSAEQPSLTVMVEE